MTRNDLELETYVREVHRANDQIDMLTREGRDTDLFVELSNIEQAAHRAQVRLNELRFQK